MELTEEESRELNSLYEMGCRYIARDESDILYAYSKKPKKTYYEDGTGQWRDGEYITEIYNDPFGKLFPGIFWEDDEAYSIKEMLGK